MLQIDYIYEFFFKTIFNDFETIHLNQGVYHSDKDIVIFTQKHESDKKIFFYDQEPLIPEIFDELVSRYSRKGPGQKILCTSEISQTVDRYCKEYNLHSLYYLFHGFAALDWYRGYYSLNINNKFKTRYSKDYITYNRLINDDRSYRNYFVSQLAKYEMLDNGLISFNVNDLVSDWRDEVTNPSSKLSVHAKSEIEKYLFNIFKLTIDTEQISGSASASIPHTIDRLDYNNDTPDYDAFWHIVTETVFYYDKLHLTEKIFKPIVSKQPFMLIGAPGNLAYLQKYGFKTFDSVIDESYDTIQDNDARINHVVNQLLWYCKLTQKEKREIANECQEIVDYNFNHFYNEFQDIIVLELLSNVKTVFHTMSYNYNHIDFKDIYSILTK